MTIDKSSRFWFLSVLLIFMAQKTEAQLAGPTAVMVGEITQYSITTTFNYSSWDFSVTNGIVTSQNKTVCVSCGSSENPQNLYLGVQAQTLQNGRSTNAVVIPGATLYSYSSLVHWNQAGIGTVNFVTPNSIFASLSVTICGAPVTPSGVTFEISSNGCGPKTVTYSGTVKSTWYWQSSSTGTSTIGSGATFSVQATGIYYLREYRCGSWSASLATPKIMVVPLPETPTRLMPSTNTCGVKIISYTGTPPIDVGWFWQGVKSFGTDHSSDASLATTFLAVSSGTYYIGSMSATGCWNYKSITVLIDNAPPPPSKSLTYCEWNLLDLQTPPTTGNVNWYSSTGKLLKQGFSYAPQNLNAGTYIFNMKTVSADGCEGSDSAPFRLRVSANCDSLLNWKESTVYTLDPTTKKSLEVGANRSYHDGLGQEVQSQLKCFSFNQVLAQEKMFDRFGRAAASTLPAAINSHNFAYRYRFATSSTPGNPRYSANDFDLISGAGGIFSPNPINDNGPGSLGWYYGPANSMEPFSPTTLYPYSRKYSAPGPDPVNERTAGPGNSFRMGMGHEANVERVAIIPEELGHYSIIRTYFTSDNDLLNLDRPDRQILSMLSTQGVTMTTINEYIKVTCITNIGNPGITAIQGNLKVVPQSSYTLKIKGYSKLSQLNIVAEAVDGVNFLLPSQMLPIGGSNDTWTSIAVTIPAGITTISIGIKWIKPVIGDSFYISDAELIQSIPVSGCKYITTDPDGKMTASFVDPEGRTIATARVITKYPANTYDTWTYNFYNKIGQVVAVVPPAGVNITTTSRPLFVTSFKYDNVGRAISTSSTDQGTTEFIYRSDGRMKFSQNSEQRKSIPRRFDYTNYDLLGRVIEIGEYIGNQFVFESATTSEKAAASVLNNSILENIGFSGGSNNLDIGSCSEVSKIYYQKIDEVPDPAHQDQTFMDGSVFKTTNVNSTTWYSYDEQGRIRWTVQQFVGLGIKTTDYRYDFIGNIVQITFQKGKSDSFYHYFTYDADSRLRSVSTSTNDVDKILQVTYTYYLHGPLKRVELGENIQGIDYTYDIDGSLKAINGVNTDPGADGQGIHKSFSPDAFGMVIDYYAGDYQGTKFSLPQSKLPNSFGGRPRSIGWISAVDYPMSGKIYEYTFDNSGQFIDGNFGVFDKNNPSNPAFFSQAYHESVSSYDRNGNIMGLRRNDALGNSVGDYSYIYEANTNKLDKVKSNSELLTDYSYNSIGQIVQMSDRGSTMFLSYNSRNVVKDVRDSIGRVLESFDYDERGFRVRTTIYAAGIPVKYDYFVRDLGGRLCAIYEQKAAGEIVQAELPIQGLKRVGVYNRQQDKYYYELKDHLGNVRVVVGAPYKEDKRATYEASLFPQEYGGFLRFENAKLVNSLLFDHTHRNTTAPLNSNRSQRLNGSVNERYGLAQSLNVMPGDRLQLEVYAKFVDTNKSNWSASFATLMGQLITINTGIVSDGPLYSSSTSSFNHKNILPHDDDGVGPKAYINWILFDKNYQYIRGGYSRLSSIAKENGQDIAHERLSPSEIIVSKPGYAYIYLSNENEVPIDVYFDDFKITQMHSAFVAGGDYYPFGLPMIERQLDQLSFRYGYQGESSEIDSLTKTNYFPLRMYDPRFARWLSPDPDGQFNSPYVAMDNNPIIGTDETGGFCEECEAIRATGTMVFPHVDILGVRSGQIDGLLSGLKSIEGHDLNYAQDPSGRLYYLNVSVNGTDAYKYGTDGWEMYHSDIALANTRRIALNDFVEKYHSVIEEVYMGAVTGPLIELSVFRAFAVGGRLFSREAAKGALEYTKSSFRLGQQMHKAYKVLDVVEGVALKEFRGIPGMRPDFVDFGTKTIYELKPFNPRAMQQGLNQLNRYKSAFEQNYGGVWSTILETY